MNVMCWGEFNNSSAQPIEAEFHFNYWPQIVSRRFRKKPYLDIGVKLNSNKDLSSLVFWFPKEFKKSFEIENSFEDLGSRIKDSKTASLVFNEVLQTSSDAQKPKQTTVSIPRTDEEFIIYELSEENVDAKLEYGGLTLRIALNQLNNQGIIMPIYIRFRLMGNALKDIEKKIVVKNKLLQSAFTQTSYIDFRFNDIRSCNSGLQEHLVSLNTQIIIKKVHFLIMARSAEEVIASEPITARILEAKAWENYLGSKIKQVCVAYHWRFDNLSQNSCIIYARYKILHCNVGTIALYILILILLTVSMNLISSFLYEYFQSLLSAASP